MSVALYYCLRIAMCPLVDRYAGRRPATRINLILVAAKTIILYCNSKYFVPGTWAKLSVELYLPRVGAVQCVLWLGLRAMLL